MMTLCMSRSMTVKVRCCSNKGADVRGKTSELLKSVVDKRKQLEDARVLNLKGLHEAVKKIVLDEVEYVRNLCDQVKPQGMGEGGCPLDGAHAASAKEDPNIEKKEEEVLEALKEEDVADGGHDVFVDKSTKM
jgi:hypothetical protein